MNIFATVGTTSYDSMIKALDKIFIQKDESINIIYQIAGGCHIPKSGSYFSFVDDVSQFYRNSDLIITHAGAGTVFGLLKLNKKFIIVPNLERIDKHQLDIAKYMDENNHALVVWDLSELYNVFKSSYSFIPTPFVSDGFFMTESIIKYINDI